MDFHTTALKGIIVLGAIGIVAGLVIICLGYNLTAGIACIGLGSNALSGMIGFITAPKIQPPSLTISDIINQAAIDAAKKES